MSFVCIFQHVPIRRISNLTFIMIDLLPRSLKFKQFQGETLETNKRPDWPEFLAES